MRLPLLSRSNLSRSLIPAIAVFAYGTLGCSCTKTHESQLPEQTVKEVQFSSAITGYGKTRAYDTQWGEDDAIGIFTHPNGTRLSASYVVHDNVQYTTTGDGIFYAATDTDKISIHDGDWGLDFVAYYPYKEHINGFQYSIDISDQSIQEEIDVLYSNNVKNIEYETTLDPLSFDHVLSKIVLNVTNSGESGLNDLNIKMKGLPTRGILDLGSGFLLPDDLSVEDFEMYIYTTSEGKTAEALVMPTDDASGIKFEVTLADEIFRFDFPAEKLERGGRYTYAVTLNSTAPPIVEPVKGWVELPETKIIENTYTSTHFMESGRNYSLLYDAKYMISYWVAYPLVADHIGTVSRTNSWVADPNISSSLQPVLTNSYTDSSYDRGHQIPSGDRTKTVLANRQTFYFSNSTPQLNRLNQDGWVTMEDKVRAFCRNCDTLYVVTGAALPPEGEIEYKYDRSGNNIAVPAYYYKALARRVGDTFTTVGYKFDHVATPKTVDLETKKVTIKELEEMTGFTFFPALGDDLKNNTNTTGW